MRLWMPHVDSGSPPGYVQDISTANRTETSRSVRRLQDILPPAERRVHDRPPSSGAVALRDVTHRTIRAERQQLIAYAEVEKGRLRAEHLVAIWKTRPHARDQVPRRCARLESAGLGDRQVVS